MVWEYSIKQFSTGERWIAEDAVAETMRLEDQEAQPIGGASAAWVGTRAAPR